MTNLKSSLYSTLFYVIIGFMVGIVLSATHKNKEIVKLKEEHKKEIAIKIQEERKIINILDNEVVRLSEVAKKDSVEILRLKDKIVLDAIKTEQKIKEITKLTPNEKKNWILNRYHYDSIK